VVALLGGGCGDDAGGSEARRSVPDSLSKAQSAAEDSVDLILAGKRDKTIKSARTLDDLAQGKLADDLEGIASKEELGELQARADELAKIVLEGEPLTVAMAANHAVELIAGFFGRFETEAPGVVWLLDYFDSEARLRALAHQIDPLRAAVDQLSKTWAELSPGLPTGDRAAAARTRFDAHVAAMTSLVGAGTDFDGLAAQAAHGLDLVDELEDLYTR
jgi:hypothetical protein